MHSFLTKFLLILSFSLLLNTQDTAVEQTGMMNSKIHQYQDVLSLDTSSIQSNCAEVKKYYELSIEAYDFLSTFSIETMEETLQNIGKLRTLGQSLEEQASATFEQQALREQLEETRNQRRLDELQWRVNWSSKAGSSDVPEEEINAMKEEISEISGDKQKELDELIKSKTEEQSSIIEEIQLREHSYDQLNAEREDLKAEITVLNDKIEDNQRKYQETIESNSTRGNNLTTLQLQLNFFNEKKKQANSYNAIKQLSQLSMSTEDQINNLTTEIENANQTLIMLQQSNNEVNDSLITKQAKLQEIELQMETINTQLLQVKHDQDQVSSFIQQAKQEQEILLSQINKNSEESNFSKQLQNQEQSFLQLGSNKLLSNEQKQKKQNLERIQTKIILITQKLTSTNNLSEKQKLETELKKVSNEYKLAKDAYLSKHNQLEIIDNNNKHSSAQQLHLKQSKQKVKVIVPTKSKAPIKEAYPVPNIKGQKSGQTITQAKQPESLEKSINPQVEGERRGKQVNTLKELILKYEELVTLKESYLERQLKIVERKEKIVGKKEKEIRKAKEMIRKAVEKCKRQKKQIIMTAKEERESKEYKKKLKEAKLRLNLLMKRLKKEMKREEVIFKRKKKMEEEEKKLQEKQNELDKAVEAIEKKIFESSDKKKKTQFIELDKIDSYPLNSDNKIAETNLIQKEEAIEPAEPKTESQLQKQEQIVDQQQKQAEKEKEIIQQKQSEIKIDEQEAQKKVIEIELKEKQLQEKSIQTQQEIESINEEINRCKLILSSGDKQSQDFQVCEWQSQDYEKKLQQLQQLKQDYQAESKEFQQQKDQFYSTQANNLLYSFLEVNSAQIQLSQMSEGLSQHFETLLQFTDSNKKQLSKSIRHADGMVYLLQSTEKLSNDLKTVLVSIPDNTDEVKVTLKQVIDEITKLYETAIVQRNLKQGQNAILEKQRVLGKLQQACLEAQKILHQEQQ